MTTEHKTRLKKQYYLTTFSGERGRCLQVTGRTHYIEHPTTNQIINMGQYSQLTVNEAKEMIKDLQDFIDNNLKNKSLTD